MVACLPLCQPARLSAARTCRRRAPSTRAALTVRPTNERGGQQKERLLPLLSDYVQATVRSETPAAPAGALPPLENSTPAPAPACSVRHALCSSEPIPMPLLE